MAAFGHRPASMALRAVPAAMAQAYAFEHLLAQRLQGQV
jgi:hypothetical protein